MPDERPGAASSRGTPLTLLGQPLSPGDVVIAPAGTPHGAKSGGLVLLSVFGPGQDPASWDRVQVEE